jgi:hypothetical protein
MDSKQRKEPTFSWKKAKKTAVKKIKRRIAIKEKIGESTKKEKRQLEDIKEMNENG